MTPAPAGDRPDAHALEAALGLPVTIHPSVESTMDTARADPEPGPHLHLAIRQSAGRGRRGRTWESPPGNLHATFCWPDPEAAWPSSVLAAVQLAWAETLDGRGVREARVKWPNDGWVGERKWAGAVAERAPGPVGERLLLGLGCNLERVPGGLPAGSATALADHWSPWPGVAAATEVLLGAAVAVLRGGPAGIPARLAGWPRCDALAPDEPLRVESPEGPLEGRYAGVDPDGRLRLRTEQGERRISAGEVLRLRRAG